jgi:DNA invertase Pin-like site-specific DNA recombinase
MMMTEGKRIGYARVSTTGQSLEAQLEALKKAGAERTFQEKASGVKQDRPELLTLLDYVREGDTVIVTKLDRVARSTKHLLEIVDNLHKKGVTFKVLNIDLDTSTPTGKLMLTMLGAIATFEREMMLERQAEGIAIAKAKGTYKGRKPTAREKASEIIRLVKEGMNKEEVSRNLEISRASVFRVLKDAELTK